ncbi:MAG: pyridoxine 5'-phosphate synthase [Proteobacteria bacterium]|nr:MAG: pyridoxine 5'-phosphate synthase [Pseudomonadota bacterium]
MKRAVDRLKRASGKKDPAKKDGGRSLSLQSKSIRNVTKTGPSPNQLPRLGVNIDHVATLRQLRGTPYPSLTRAAELATQGGAEQITVHLREDRRHIQDADVVALKKMLKIPLNLEMAVTSEMEKFALQIKPEWVCLVPEKREEVTTEGGLNVKKAFTKLKTMIPKLQKQGIKVSLFIEPSTDDVQTSHNLGANAVEIIDGNSGFG